MRPGARQCGRDLEEYERGRVEEKESEDPGDARCSTKGAGAGLRRTRIPQIAGVLEGGWQRVRARRGSAQARAGRGKSAGTSLPAPVVQRKAGSLGPSWAESGGRQKVKERLRAGYRSGGWEEEGEPRKCEASALKERFLFLSNFCLCV